jgi:lipopolysaccharide export system protein LptA
MDGFKNSEIKTILFLLLFVATTLFGRPQSPPTDGKQKVTKIKIENADSIELSKNNNPDIWILRGNVAFMHDSTYLYCDSAYLNNLANSLEAFSRVLIKQGDTLSINGDYLYYDGNTNLAEMHENVRMINNDLTLFTNNFEYDRGKNIASFLNEGLLLDSLNVLTAISGKYFPATKLAIFNKDVILTNDPFNPNQGQVQKRLGIEISLGDTLPDFGFVLNSDTLKYNTESKIAHILGPSVIESDSGTIYSRSGWYSTITKESTLYERSQVVSKDKTRDMIADTMSYNKQEGLLEAFGNMVLTDTVKKVILMGNYGYYDEITKFAFATDSAQVIEFSQRDSSFLHADTVQMKTIGNEREMKAYYGVRYYRANIQAVCDSLLFNTADSIVNMYKNPILWTGAFQVNGDTIRIFFNDSTLEKMHVLSYAYAFEELDSAFYNQLKGRDLYVYFVDGEMDKIDVDGSGEAIYYPLNDDKVTYSGRTKIEASYICIRIKDRKMNRISWFPQPKVEILPISFLDSENKFLKGFKNFNYLRPINSEDIFRHIRMSAEDIPPPRRVRGQR